VKILAHVHKYPPVHNAGAEWMMHSVLSHLKTVGHEVLVNLPVHATRRSTSGLEGAKQFSWTIDGVEVKVDKKNLPNLELFSWADVIFTHLDQTRFAMSACAKTNKPLVHFVHNDKQLAFHRVTKERAQLVVFNSQWIKDKIHWQGRETVVHPPIIQKDYRLSDKGFNDAIVLVNLTEEKGASVFYELAWLMPNRRFVGVKGAYGVQVFPKTMPPNVEIMENTPNPTDFYDEASIILMPSSYESWGRVAMEAACVGIPVIAHPTPGLLESMGDCALWAHRDAISQWIQRIEDLDDVLYRKGVIEAQGYRFEEMQRKISNQLTELTFLLDDVVTIGV